MVGFFSDLKTIRDDLFLQQNADLPAIGGDLGLQAAASSTAQYSPAQAFSVAFGIAGSVAGPFDPEVSAALWVVSEIAAAIPSSSPTAMSTFPSTYAGLQDKFAQMVSETEKGLGVMSQQVRQDAGLLGLVGQLRARGTWTFDMIGMASAANQAFAQSVYQALMPTLYERYTITGCVNGWLTAYPNDSPCTAPAAGPGVLRGRNVGQDFTTIAQPYDEANGVPCGRPRQLELHVLQHAAQRSHEANLGTGGTEMQLYARQGGAPPGRSAARRVSTPSRASARTPGTSRAGRETRRRTRRTEPWVAL